MIYAKRKRYSGHWIMRGEEKIGEAWKFPRRSGFGMSIGGHLTVLKPMYWRNGEPSTSWGYMAIAAPRLIDLVAIAQEYFDNVKTEDYKCE